jgi:hypothetical protein
MAKSRALPTFSQMMSKGNNEEHHHTGKGWQNKISPGEAKSPTGKKPKKGGIFSSEPIKSDH